VPTGFYQHIKGAKQFTGLRPIKYKSHQPLVNISVCYPSCFKFLFPPSFSGGEITGIPLHWEVVKERQPAGGKKLAMRQ